jgi:uncharacterized protein (TIGR03437 family)
MRHNSVAAAAFVLMTTFFAPVGAQGQSLTYTYSYDGPPLPIFRDSANIITIANIFVPRAILISKVTANIDVDYPRPEDMNIFMYSPILTRTILLERNCGSQGALVNITFDDAAPTRYSDACPTASGGTYQGNEPLSNFNNQIALGVWSLAVENNGSDDFIGYIRGFTLVFTGTAQTTKPITSSEAVFGAAGFQSGVVAPGEMINIAGVNLGPGTAVVAPAGNLPTSLGGVQVTFDGAPAALSYASANVLTVQAPFGLSPGAMTNMVVSYQGNTSDSVLLNVLSSVPGIYTQNGNGRGPATAVNADGSINSAAHPAPKGTYVSFYAAGLGAVTPALATGQAPPNSPLSSTVSPVSALVDGYQATVTFAGAAPQYPGLYQINMLIPLLAGFGAQPLTIYVGGGQTSQNFVTIFVQ